MILSITSPFILWTLQFKIPWDLYRNGKLGTYSTRSCCLNKCLSSFIYLHSKNSYSKPSPSQGPHCYGYWYHICHIVHPYWPLIICLFNWLSRYNHNLVLLIECDSSKWNEFSHRSLPLPTHHWDNQFWFHKPCWKEKCSSWIKQNIIGGIKLDFKWTQNNEKTRKP